MKLPYFVVLPVLLFSLNSIAQMELSPASVAGDSSSSKDPVQTTWISGRLALEGGSQPPNHVTIILRCGMEERARVTSGSNGTFSIMLSKEPDGKRGPFGMVAARGLEGCELDTESADYTAQAVRLFGQNSESITDVGTIVVHPKNLADGGTVSATTLAAPDKAKSAFAKGQQQERKGRWAAACDSFRRAIQVYPRYAIAWLELGRSQVKQNQLAQAQQSFRQAATQDSRLLAAYSESAKLALQQQHWNDLAAATERLLELSPNASADAWFLNSAANFNLGQTQRAESSALRGLNLDPHHEVPQLEYLYAMILARQGAYAPAVEHLQNYLRLSPKAEDATTAAERLKELQHLVDSAHEAQR